MIKVNNSYIKYVDGMTVGEALKEAEEKIDQMIIVIVNGEVVSQQDINDMTISDKTEILLLPLVSGG